MARIGWSSPSGRATADIFTPKFFEVLQQVTDDVFFIPGVDRTRVMSLFTPNVRFTEVVEDGISGGNVIPDDFAMTDEGLAKVRANLLKSAYVGRLVANDFSSALVVASLLEIDPTTGERLDYLNVADQLEEVRQKYSNHDVGVEFDYHIIGFAKVIGDIAAGVARVVLFFLVAFFITVDLRLPLLPERQAHPDRRRLLADRGHLAAGSADPCSASASTRCRSWCRS